MTKHTMKPLRQADLPPLEESFVLQMTLATKLPIDVVRKALQDEAKAEYWRNDLYQVAKTELSDGVTHLNIRRIDGRTIYRDWRHFQAIKNQLCGPEREGIELYPAESRLVDTSNKYHIWVLPAGERVPLGMDARDVQGPSDVDLNGVRQRGFE